MTSIDTGDTLAHLPACPPPAAWTEGRCTETQFRAGVGASDRPVADAAGFTRVELAIIVLTCATLVGLILPVLAASGDGGKRIVCFNNLHRLGIAMAMYGNDNRDYLAAPNWDNGAPITPGWLYSSANGVIPDPGPGGTTNPVAAYSTGLWFQYTRDPKTYLCPVDIESDTYASPPGSNTRLQRLSSYVMNGAVSGFMSGLPGRTYKITEVWNPACYLLWGPDENYYRFGNPGAWSFNDGANYPIASDGLVERLHTPNGGGVLSVDGAVQFVSIQRFSTESGSQTKSLAWWSPFSSSGH